MVHDILLTLGAFLLTVTYLMVVMYVLSSYVDKHKRPAKKRRRKHAN